MLTLEDKIEIQKQITLEKDKRNLDCEQFTDLTSAEQHLKNIKLWKNKIRDINAIK